jgi:putative RecB family exonuclease
MVTSFSSYRWSPAYWAPGRRPRPSLKQLSVVGIIMVAEDSWTRGMMQQPGTRTYSYSGLKTFTLCPLKYKFEYLDRERTGIESVEAFAGKCVHRVLRRLYEELWNGDLPELEDLRDFYESTWDNEWHPGVRIVRRNTRESDYFNFGLDCIENFYKSNSPFDESQTVILEGEVTFWLNRRAGRGFKCVIDRVSSLPDGTYEIHDYKTGRREPELGEAERQMSLYQMAVEAEFPQAKSIELVLHDLPRDRIHRKRQGQFDLQRIYRDTNELIDCIEREWHFAPRPGPLCDWCEFLDICPAFRERPGQS